jgi:hypothetical protein
MHSASCGPSSVAIDNNISQLRVEASMNWVVSWIGCCVASLADPLVFREVEIQTSERKMRQGRGEKLYTAIVSCDQCGWQLDSITFMLADRQSTHHRT